jgi:hypothetical protein
MGKKHLIGGRRECLVPSPTLDEMREARRQSRHAQPALTKHTPVTHQRNPGAKKPANGKAKPGAPTPRNVSGRPPKPAAKRAAKP